MPRPLTVEEWDARDAAERQARREKAKRSRRAQTKRAHRRGDQGGRIKPR